jgi:hypothetical protein
MASRLPGQLLILALVIAGMNASALACLRSPGEVPFCHVFQNTKTIFTGKVIEVKPHVDNTSNSIPKSEGQRLYTPQYVRVSFLITDSFKGTHGTTVETLALAKEITSCDEVYKFEPGDDWLVFADRNERQSADYVVREAGKFGDADVRLTLERLIQIRENGIDGSIYGQFLMNHPFSLINIKGFPVTAYFGDETLTAKLDEFGQYAFPTLSPGKYKMRIFLPYGGYVLDAGRREVPFAYDNQKKLNFYEFETSVNEGECSYDVVRAFPAKRP